MGDSCFPISPVKKNENKNSKIQIISTNDQMKVIL